MDKKVPTGYKITDARYMSFFLEGTLSSELLNLYLKFENEKWYKITISDGYSSFRLIDEPMLSIRRLDEDFDYPISMLRNFDVTRYGTLKKIEEYIYKSLEDGSMGYTLRFDNDTCFTIYDHDEDIVLKDGEHSELLRWPYVTKEKELLDVTPRR